MNLQPIFLKLDGRPALLVGAGTVALEKIHSLLRTGVRLRVIAPNAKAEIKELAAEGRLEWVQRAFAEDDLDGQFIVIAATDQPEVNAAVYRAAVARNIACNSVDDIPNCDFFFGSVVRRGDLQIAISTAGESPAVAQRLRREIDEQLPQDLGDWLASVGQLRREILETHPRNEERKLLLHELAYRSICDSPLCATRRRARSDEAAHGKVALVGAGPGDPELLTVKALRKIEAAEVVLHDDLVPEAILTLASPNAEVVNVGKRCGTKSITQEEIHAMMIDHARSGRSVVRLKSGDPLIFGRAAEEMAALTEAGVAYEVVPGITAAFAAAAAVGCSLTSRNSASNVIFSTGHHAQSHNVSPMPEIEDATRVVYMPGRDLRLLALEWMQEGLPGDFPCAIVSRAGQPEQQVQFTILADLADVEAVPAPSLLVAGWALRENTPAAQTGVRTAVIGN
jgi:uroporphyrin-III C-methyltransferase/precorrin-2 dehydrogenase/sirohydrochlorin ferrochelatase